MANVYESTGLTIEVSSNVSSIATYQKEATVTGNAINIAKKATAYNHELNAVGGYISCKVSIAENKDDIFEWVKTLGKLLTVYNAETVQIWRGIINLLTIRLGALTLVVGPLLDVANKVRLVYTPIVDASLLNISGGRLYTDYAEDTDSQALYGIWTQDVSGDRLSDPDAISQRDDYLDRFSKPKKSRTTNTSSLSAATIQIEAIGIWDTMNYSYTDLNAGTRAISTKLTDVLSAHPNPGFISTNLNYITSNTNTTSRQELGDRTGQMIIKELLGLPGLASTRMLFGFYEDGIPYYTAKPSTIHYQFNSRDKRAVIRDTKRNEIRPWNVKPGKWIYYTDLFPGENIDTDLENDDRAEFVEVVRFTAPDTVEVNGNVLSSASARVGARGLSGI